MLNKYLVRLKDRYFPALRRQKGQSLVIFAMAFMALLAMLGLAIDLSLVFFERIRLERALDAAALASAVELPYEEDAMTRAIEYLQLNDYDVADGDIQILVRGCLATDLDDVDSEFQPGNVDESGYVGLTGPLTMTNQIVGALYRPAVDTPVRATFVIDTGAYQAEEGLCDPDDELFGTADKIRVAGQVNVTMNFMQFFGLPEVSVQNVSIAESISRLDIMMVLDVSGSMEYETACYDCWVRRDADDPNFPGNGYFNPLHQDIPGSPLCTNSPQPYVDGGSKYLVHEAELFSRDVPLHGWTLQRRGPGQGFWAIQRASRRAENPLNPVESFDSSGDPYYQGNKAGLPDEQSSNVCNPLADGISCETTTDSKADIICDDESNIANDDGDIIIDCSAYVKAQPYTTYGPGEDVASADPKLHGGAYNAACFNADGTLSGTCWDTGPSSVPWLEYDFTPTWDNTTYIWLRTIGGGERAYEWDGDSPASPQDWQDVVYWQVDSGVVNENTGADPYTGTQPWRDNRAANSAWKWVQLGWVDTGTYDPSNPAQHTFRLYQGSAGYKVDKIVFTNDGDASPDVLSDDHPTFEGKGPAATPGSATREACNLCNPAFGGLSPLSGGDGYVSSADCGCPQNSVEATGFLSGTLTTTGAGCSTVLTSTLQLQDDLFSGLQPLRSAQESAKNFVERLDPKIYQVGLLAFSDDVINDEGYRVKLQCLNSADDVNACVEDDFPEVREAVERHWPRSKSNIAAGLKEALEELGVKDYASGHDCTDTINDGQACDRQGAARRVIILLSDGQPDATPATGCPAVGDPGFVEWQGQVGANDPAYNCALHYAFEAANNDVLIYAIGLGAGADIDFLTTLATGTDPDPDVGKNYFTGRGGTFFLGSDTSSLDSIFDQILSDAYVRIIG